MTGAIDYGGAGSAVIEHQAVVSVVHLEQSRACEPVAIAVAYEAAACGARAVARIGETHKRLICVS